MSASDPSQAATRPASHRRRRELARADRVLPGIWRLRLPLPWPGVPHVNAYAITAGSGIVLVDTGIDEPGALSQLERALEQAGLRLEHIRLLVCTHAHSDHYGLAGPILDAAGCELWMHPDHAHMTRAVADPERLLERRIEVARQSGVPGETIARYQAARRDGGLHVARLVLPDRPLVAGTRVETDLGPFTVYETPGHAPSHVCLHQAERRIMISGDHLLGRVSLFYDYGNSPDPVGEFLSSLDTVGALESDLCLAGHGRPFRDVKEHIEANRREVAEHLRRVQAALADGPTTAFEIVPALLGDTHPTDMMINWGLTEALSYLRHLELRGDAERVAQAERPDRWRAVGAA